jgi:hypothetical protein
MNGAKLGCTYHYPGVYLKKKKKELILYLNSINLEIQGSKTQHQDIYRVPKTC